MNVHENDSAQAESDNTHALASEGEPGRWVTDPDDPNFEIWEPARVESKSVNPSKRVVEWSDGRTPDPSKICTARRSDGTPCRKQRVTGAVVCTTHGGRAPQVKAKARVRLEMAADKLARELLGIAMDDDSVPANVKLAAVKDALDRAGLSAKTAVEVEVGPTKPFQEVLETIMIGGSRAASRASRGEPVDHDADAEDNAWIMDELIRANTIDAEIVDEAELLGGDDGEDRDDRAPEPQDQSCEPTGSGSGLLDLADALDQLHGNPPPPPRPRRR